MTRILFTRFGLAKPDFDWHVAQLEPSTRIALKPRAMALSPNYEQFGQAAGQSSPESSGPSQEDSRLAAGRLRGLVWRTAREVSWLKPFQSRLRMLADVQGGRFARARRGKSFFTGDAIACSKVTRGARWLATTGGQWLAQYSIYSGQDPCGICGSNRTRVAVGLPDQRPPVFESCLGITYSGKQVLDVAAPPPRTRCSLGKPWASDR